MRAKSNSPSPAQRQVQAGAQRTKFLSVIPTTRMFTWTPIYKELAKALLPFKNRQPDLVRILDEIKQTGVPIIRLVDAPDPATTPPLTTIDPFTFFAAFNRGLTNQNRMAILTTLKEKFRLNSAVPADFSGVPVVDNKLSW